MPKLLPLVLYFYMALNKSGSLSNVFIYSVFSIVHFLKYFLWSYLLIYGYCSILVTPLLLVLLITFVVVCFTVVFSSNSQLCIVFIIDTLLVSVCFVLVTHLQAFDHRFVCKASIHIQSTSKHLQTTFNLSNYFLHCYISYRVWICFVIYALVKYTVFLLIGFY